MNKEREQLEFLLGRLEEKPIRKTIGVSKLKSIVVAMFTTGEVLTNNSREKAMQGIKEIMD